MSDHVIAASVTAAFVALFVGVIVSKTIAVLAVMALAAVAAAVAIWTLYTIVILFLRSGRQ